MFSKPLIQFSVDGLGCVPSLLFSLRPNYGRGNGNLSKGLTVVFSAPDPTAGHCQPMSSLETPGHPQASLAQSLVGTLPLSPGSCAFQ